MCIIVLKYNVINLFIIRSIFVVITLHFGLEITIIILENKYGGESMKKEKVTISDIAEALNISAISVSRALSGQSGVGSELRDKILSKAKEMGYLKSKGCGDIKILMLHQKPYIQDNSNFSYMVQGIESAIQNIGAEYNVEFIDKESQDKMRLPAKLSKGGSFDGIIFIGRFNSAYAGFLKERVKNQVFYSGYSPAIDCDSVWFNFNNGGYKECQYLIRKGHKKIAFIGSGNFRNKEKLLGITTAMEEYGVDVIDEFFLDSDNDFENIFLGFMKRSERPSAVICGWDFTAIRLIKLLYENGIRVPEDISVMGNGNTDMSLFSIPSLTTLDLNIEYSCKCAVDLLTKRIHNPEKPYESIMVYSTLVERGSVKDI